MDEGVRAFRQTPGAVLLDVREPDEYAGGHVPGSVNLPLGQKIKALRAEQGITREDIDRGLNEIQWDSLISMGQAFSAECCKDIYNYISKDFGMSLR